jgi:hypothetical protein
MSRNWIPVAALILVACAPLAPDVRRIDGAPALPVSATLPEVLDQAPTRPYAQIGVVDAKGAPGMTSVQVLARIREQAQQLGADAVILQDVSARAPTESKYNPVTGGYSIVQGDTIPAFKGYAIKYQR